MDKAPAADFALADGTDARTLPKVLLHDHLDGGVRPATIIELAEELDLDLPSRDPEHLRAWFRDAASSGSLAAYLTAFDVTVSVMQTAPALRRIAHEAIVDLAADGVVYAELRWAPEQHLRRGLTLDEAVEAVGEGLREGISEVRAHGGRIRAQQILSAMRQLDRSEEIADLAVRHRGSGTGRGGVAAFDLAGPETGHPAGDHQAALDICADEFLPVTLHAGEEEGIESIVSALIDGRALRLGHGFRIADDISIEDDEDDDDRTYVSLGRVAEWVKDRRIPLEIAPSSNLDTGGVEALSEHPVDLLHQLGFAVTINTDNRLMSGTTLSRELVLLADEFDYELDDLEAFQLNAAEGAFLPVDDRNRLADLISDGFDEARE